MPPAHTQTAILCPETPVGVLNDQPDIEYRGTIFTNLHHQRCDPDGQGNSATAPRVISIMTLSVS